MVLKRHKKESNNQWRLLSIICITYKKDGHPRQANVIKGDRAAEGVDLSRLAIGVVQVPVDAVRLIDQPGLKAGNAFNAILRDKGRQGVTLVHAGAVLSGADELLVRAILAEIFVVEGTQLASVKKNMETSMSQL